MNQKLLVSIVVPIFNQKDYLDNSIQALIDQSYSNIEIVLVNDGSTDNSLEIINSFKNNDNRIVIVDKENGGLVDATIAGIRKATGDYIAFLDPDDYVGTKFIENFVTEIDDDYDFIAAGFYKDNQGRLTPYLLKDDAIYDIDDIRQLKTRYLISDNSANIPNDIFVSRWNKIYKRSCLDLFVDRFAEFKNISLGEDSLFTYLLLSNCHLGKTIQACNTYYYNVGNQNSMMKNDAIDNHLLKAQKSFDIFYNLLKEGNDLTEQAYALYYHLVNSVFNRVLNQNKGEFKKLFKSLRKNKTYKDSLKILIKRSSRLKEKIPYILKKGIVGPVSYYFLTVSIKKCTRKLKAFIKDWINTFKGFKKGVLQSLRLAKFKKSRRIAFEDIYDKLPLIEERVVPFLNNYDNKKTVLSECPIEKNIFVFWWDGFDKAPDIVRECLKSVNKYHPESRIIEITKDTYQDYTDINPVIIGDFKKGKISVQTFSDILRFNLLKNNGGTWIDATIFFDSEYDLTEGLKYKPIESVEFSNSSKYLEYKNEKCSWSGYFISSRKNSVFVNAVDYIFEQYYLKYKTYTTYFFIDAVLMICKINKLDDGALDNISYNPGDMFVLRQLLLSKYSPYYLETIKRIPQKLQWDFKHSNDDDTVYQRIIVKGE